MGRFHGKSYKTSYLSSVSVIIQKLMEYFKPSGRIHDYYLFDQSKKILNNILYPYIINTFIILDCYILVYLVFYTAHSH
jgi:hypothetical protein